MASMECGVSPSSDPCIELIQSKMNIRSVKAFFIKNPPILCCLVYKHSMGGFWFGWIAWRATNPIVPSYIKQGDLRTVLPQELEQILSFEPYGGGVFIGMNADQSGALQKGLAQPEGHLMILVIEQAQWRHRAGD